VTHSWPLDPHELSLAKSAAYVALAMNRNTAMFSSAFHGAGPITTADVWWQLTIRAAVVRDRKT